MTVKPVQGLSNRELLEESAETLRFVRGLLAELEPLLVIARGMSGTGPAPSYVQAAGLRRVLKKGRHDATTTDRTPRPAPGAPLGRAEPGAELG